MPATSLERTEERLRAEGLPFQLPIERLEDVTADVTCSGCAMGIERLERFYYVCGHGGAPWRLHVVCYDAWRRRLRGGTGEAGVPPA
jgi:hypothetical protein